MILVASAWARDTALMEIFGRMSPALFLALRNPAIASARNRNSQSSYRLFYTTHEKQIHLGHSSATGSSTSFVFYTNCTSKAYSQPCFITPCRAHHSQQPFNRVLSASYWAIFQPVGQCVTAIYIYMYIGSYVIVCKCEC